jgi:two-component sensor histidine kinase
VQLWRQSQDRFAGTAFWVLDFVFQAAALVLIVLRGAIPDWMSMVLSNTLVIAGAILGFMGLERFVGKKGPHIHNYLLLALFIIVHGYFTLVQPSQAVRNLNLSVVLLLVCFQCLWLLWRRVEPGLRSLTFWVGVVFGLYCLVSVVRIAQFFIGAHAESNFFQSGLFETLMFVSFLMLLILLTYSLVLMVNKRLLMQIRTQEEKIKASLLEKETMLKEIHHRVKNNLQVISSLLALQSGYVQDEKSREIFQESQDRVSTMAKIHTMLCQSEDMSGVDFGGFIGDLAGRLQQSYGIAGSRVGIHVNVDVSLTIEPSIPCGLILNELVSNALKHAFPEGRGGEVNISMIKAGDRFVLTVQDNGIGFPEALDFQNTKSLGLELVNLLVGQMNGAITLTVEGGAIFTITFPAVSKGG